jgi:hypothetical protein
VLALSRNKAAKRAVEASQPARVAELERANAELTVELKQSWINAKVLYARVMTS